MLKHLTCKHSCEKWKWHSCTICCLQAVVVFKQQLLFLSLPEGGRQTARAPLWSKNIEAEHLLFVADTDCSIVSAVFYQVHSTVWQPSEWTEEEGRGEEEREEQEEVERAERGGGEGQQRERVHWGIRQLAEGQRWDSTEGRRDKKLFG